MVKNNIIIMAGGLGKRMNSDIPKVLHNFNKKPMIVNIIETVMKLEINKIFIVVGKYRNIIQSIIEEYVISDFIEYVIQSEALGTGHAIQSCYEKLLSNYQYKTLILSGDVPLIRVETLKKMIDLESNCVILTATVENPYGYGRIVRKDNIFLNIQEEKDCTIEEKKISEINAGIYLIHTNYLIGNILDITNKNKQEEYYLTDIFKLLNIKNVKIDLLELKDSESYEIRGVNTMEQLRELNLLSKHII